jgi:hypothetical protein
MRIRGGRYGAVTIVVALCVVAAGCTTESSVGGGSGESSSTPSSTPAFASEEEALAAAEEAYGAYAEVVDEVLAGGGADPSDFATVAYGSALEAANADADEFARLGYVAVGATQISSVKLQAVKPNAVSIYVCEDISNVDLLDSSGKSIVDPDRPNLQAFEVHLTVVSVDLLVSERMPWDGDGICD